MGFPLILYLLIGIRICRLLICRFVLDLRQITSRRQTIPTRENNLTTFQVFSRRIETELGDYMDTS